MWLHRKENHMDKTNKLTSNQIDVLRTKMVKYMSRHKHVYRALVISPARLRDKKTKTYLYNITDKYPPSVWVDMLADNKLFKLPRITEKDLIDLERSIAKTKAYLIEAIREVTDATS